MKRFVSNFLTSDSSFITGAGSVFNLGGSYYRFNVVSSSAAADAKALARDWAMVGQDMRDALAEFKRESKKQVK